MLVELGACCDFGAARFGSVVGACCFAGVVMFGVFGVAIRRFLFPQVLIPSDNELLQGHFGCILGKLEVMR